jgi:short-subunit dehydrogenase
MSRWLHRLSDGWVRRRANPDAAALQAVAGLTPATVITGASRGIGLELARRFAAKGDAVVMIARDPGPLNEAAAAIRGDGAQRVALPLALDITDPNAFAQVQTTLQGNGLYLDVLINNAGTGLGGAFETHTAAEIDKLVALNVAALTRFTRLALPDMRARGRGGILNVASLGGFVPGPYQATYYASKAYVISLTEAVAAECSGSGVRVAVLAPGPVETSFHANMSAEDAPYRTLLPAATASKVAASARRDFFLGRRLIIPGLLNFMFAWVLRVTPHPISIPLMAWLLQPPDAKNRPPR